MTEVLQRFAGGDPELPNGFAEHAPMGAEALLTLGVDPDAVATWARRHEPVPLAPGSPSLRVRAHVLAELEADGWRTVVARRASALLPRLDAHLFHGLLRTAHAVRTIERRDDLWSRAELATALAGWAVWAGHSRDRDADPQVAEPLGAVLDAARRGAGAFVGDPSIFTLHAVTGPMAFLVLAPHLGEADHARAARAFADTHRRHRVAAPDPLDVERVRPDAAALRALADRWDAHPAKLTEAALRAHDLTGDPVFLRVADTA